MRVKESRMSMTHKSVFLELITQDSLVVYMTVMYSLLWCFMYAAELRNNMTVGLLWYSCRKRILHSFHYNLPLLLFGQKQAKWQLISVPNGSWQIKHVTEFAIFLMNTWEWTFLDTYEATSWCFCCFSINCVNWLLRMR